MLFIESGFTNRSRHDTQSGSHDRIDAGHKMYWIL